MSFHMYVPTRILFGVGKLKELHKESLPGKRALLLLSNGKSAKKSGAYDETLNQLKMAGCSVTVFQKIEANPLKETVEEGAAFARENHFDFIVALGGGSVMDASKALAVAATNPGDLWDYAFGKTGKAKEISIPPLPIVAITTTAGTGSEVDQWGVITKSDTHEKIGFGGIDALFPQIAVIDPELMKTVPPSFTAYQGFDALFHSTECYIARQANLMSDMYALTAIENIGKYLPEAVKNGDNLTAREHVAFANTLSGVVMTISSCTSEHSMEHAMSAYHQNLPHGAGLIMISMEYYRHFIQKHTCDERFVRMAQALGMKNASQPEDFLIALLDLQKACGVDQLRMQDYGITAEELDTLAQNARETMGGLFESDPIPLSHEECRAIYEKSFR
ncbi:iron-containing alcohol dehydrogenase [Ructibacterium gallinarum]|uniref:Iron-containing alcohol dehydrogenase n=1 Tax=Ructibacterium gallinarum TaxID=2779355 RepID=A0A9D5M2R9_9FIRM|nr:iron-containing alcohol dehydrogenase [Ructibacterium gallinarum]MBE5039614.1 iron-containing alcohol dehydrogenase [Ructibacterium gallinarum]